MQENQTVEWKEFWKDKYLQWVCAFANTNGGTLIIGKNDNGSNVGVENVAELLEQIPTKIRNTMGIIADVHVETHDNVNIIVINVDEQLFPVSCKGKYYSRSGSSTFELTGLPLDSLVYKRLGKTWDSIPVPDESVETLDNRAIKTFRKKALQSDRLTEEDLDVTDKLLLDKLNLYEGEYLKRAAILLFHENPEKWITGAYIKIGYFGNSDSDLLYQDEVTGPLIEQVDKALELVYQKYMKALITYEGIQRVEKYMFPKSAFREILLNAVIHKDYATCIPIQISVYEDKIYIWNPGKLPEPLTVDTLFKKHQSIPYNPKIAATFFKTGMIESWGRGFDKILVACKKSNAPLPVYSQDLGGLMVLCNEGAAYKKLRMQYLNKFENSNFINEDRTSYSFDSHSNLLNNNFAKAQLSRVKLLLAILHRSPKSTYDELAEILGVNKKTVSRDIEKLKGLGILKREGSDKTGSWIVSDTSNV